ncbi:MAG: uridine kinase [Candidatus Ratteibacteria bacterium]|nr:uridine kinase [Candidatus Ratteibacteria bacterium]
MTKPLIIGIAGGTGSGKSTLAYALKDKLGGHRCDVIPLDFYYKDRILLELKDREKLNFDEPEAFDLSLLVSHLKKIKTGKAVQIAIYDFKTHTRVKEPGKNLIPGDFLILEGILVLAEKELRSLMDLKIYVEVPPEARFQRRLSRDIKERGRTEESVKKQYQATVLPMHFKHIEPTRQFADIIVSGIKPIEESWQKIKPQLKKHL